MSKRTEKILAGLLYSLPLIFFIVCYFLIITSGEDIHQGANTTPNILGDSMAAFNHSVRLADMFAWSVINFFDYKFSFGPDVVFRIIDVLVAMSIFYMATYIVLKRKPKLRLFDATIFGLIFLLVFLTSNGLTLYAGFSKIHNYLFITFFTLLFGTIYLKDLWGEKVSNSKWFYAFMVILGFIFGFASNVTAIVFLISVFLYGVYTYIKHRKNKRVFLDGLKKFLCSWRFAGVIGIILSVILMYGVGSGLGDYNSDPAYLAGCDYWSFDRLLSEPIQGFKAVLHHNVYNFAHFFFPFVIVSIPIVLWAIIGKHKPNFKALKKDANYLVASALFIVMHVVAMSQIIYPTRLVLPAYIFAAAVYCYVIWKLFSGSQKWSVTFFAVSSAILMVAVISMRTYFAVTYYARIAPILDEIESSNYETYCVDLKTATAERIPYIHMAQEDFLVDWAMPEKIYNTRVFYCN